MNIPFENHAAVIGAAVLSSILILPAHAATMPKPPPESTQGMVAYRSGGVGQDEAKAMQRLAKQYPLEMEFLSRQGKGHAGFLADVNVDIRDKAGKEILQTKTNGPFLLARMPAGQYVVKATYMNKERERHVAVSAHGTRRVIIHW